MKRKPKKLSRREKKMLGEVYDAIGPAIKWARHITRDLSEVMFSLERFHYALGLKIGEFKEKAKAEAKEKRNAKG